MHDCRRLLHWRLFDAHPVQRGHNISRIRWRLVDTRARGLQGRLLYRDTVDEMDRRVSQSKHSD